MAQFHLTVRQAPKQKGARCLFRRQAAVEFRFGARSGVANDKIVLQ